MKLLSFIVAILVMLPSDQDGKKNYWDILLDKYEELCNACKEKKSKKEIHLLSDSLNEMMKHPEGKMTRAQRDRFSAIQNRYHGIITITGASFSEMDAPRVVRVDTVRRVEHIQVTDTVFVKEVIGSMELNQYVHNTDTIYHIIQYQNPIAVEPPKELAPELEENPAPEISHPTVTRKEKHFHPTYFILANAGIGNAVSYGATVGVVDTWGGYAGFHSDFRTISPGYSCSSEGMAGASRIMTNGNKTHSRLVVTAGVCYEITGWMMAYAGAGYGQYSLFWQDINDIWMNVSDISVKGAEIEAGGIFHLGIFGLSLGVSTTQLQYFEFKAGLGFAF